MGLIQDGDFTISYNEWNDATVYHIPTKTTFVGCGTNDRAKNLSVALDAMERIIYQKNKCKTPHERWIELKKNFIDDIVKKIYEIDEDHNSDLDFEPDWWVEMINFCTKLRRMK